MCLVNSALNSKSVPTQEVWVELVHIVHDVVALGTSVAVLQTLADALEAAENKASLSWLCLEMHSPDISHEITYISLEISNILLEISSILLAIFRSKSQIFSLKSRTFHYK